MFFLVEEEIQKTLIVGMNKIIKRCRLKRTKTKTGAGAQGDCGSKFTNFKEAYLNGQINGNL